MDDEDLRAELERLRKENQALKQAPQARVTMKVSDKGGLSVYGLGRFPVTLYKEQWIKLLGMSADIERFIREHDPLVSGNRTLVNRIINSNPIV